MERSPLRKQNKAITSSGTSGRQTYGGTFYKRWEVSQYLGITACKEDKKFSGLFDSESTKSFAELHAGIMGFFNGKQFFCGWSWWETYTYSGDISYALLEKDKSTHKPLFCHVLPSSHPKPASLGWEHVKPQRCHPWQCHEGLFLICIYMKAQWDVKPPAGLCLRSKWVESRREPGRSSLGVSDCLDHWIQGHGQKLALWAKYFAGVIQQR